MHKIKVLLTKNKLVCVYGLIRVPENNMFNIYLLSRSNLIYHLDRKKKTNTFSIKINRNILKIRAKFTYLISKNITFKYTFRNKITKMD